MPLADSPGLRISPLLHLSPQRAHLPHVPPESKRTSLLNTYRASADGFLTFWGPDISKQKIQKGKSVMLYIKSLEQAVPVFKALGSELRVRLIQILLEHQEMNMNELASSLGITNGALTSHVKKLEEAGILAILPEHSGHGNQKVCRINVDKILVDVATNNESPAENSYSIDIPIGNYFNYSVFPTCGLSTTDSLIGEVDDPRYFAHPNHVDARILWFGRGFIDYRIPNMLPPGQKIDRLTLSFEIM